VRTYTVGDNDGKLTLVNEWRAKAGVGPRHLAFYASNAYLINEFDNSVTAFDVDTRANNGKLTPLHTISTLPPTFTGSNTGADIHVTGDGRFVYASNRGHDSLAMFARDDSTGRLSSLGQFATEAKPREFSITRDNRFVVTCGQDSGRLQAARIDAADGTLTLTDTLKVGASLLWAIVDDKP
jgi:6-phosphogluconolactonase